MSWKGPFEVKYAGNVFQCYYNERTNELKYDATETYSGCEAQSQKFYEKTFWKIAMETFNNFNCEICKCDMFKILMGENHLPGCPESKPPRRWKY